MWCDDDVFFSSAAPYALLCRCMMNVNVLCDDDEINKEEDMMM